MSDSENSRNRNVQKRRLRSISNLTQQQLLHKRDLDRKAQGALRQRTKSRIQDLEDELEQLKAKSDEQNSALKQELHSLQEKNEWLEACLKQIVKLASDSSYSDPNERNAARHQSERSTSENSDCITGKLLMQCRPGPRRSSCRPS